MQLCKIFVALLGAIEQIVPVLLVTAEKKTSILRIIDKQGKNYVQWKPSLTIIMSPPCRK